METSLFQGLTCPKSELRIVRKFKSDADDAALDLRERREDLLDKGTKEFEDGEGILAWSPLFDKLALLRSLGSEKGAVSPLQSDRDGILGTVRGCVWLRWCSGGGSSRFDFLRWCRCVLLDDLQRSFAPRSTSQFWADGSSREWAAVTWFWWAWWDRRLLPRVVAFFRLLSWEGWHRGLRALTSHSADQKDSSAVLLFGRAAGRWRWWWWQRRVSVVRSGRCVALLADDFSKEVVDSDLGKEELMIVDLFSVLRCIHWRHIISYSRPIISGTHQSAEPARVKLDSTTWLLCASAARARASSKIGGT